MIKYTVITSQPFWFDNDGRMIDALALCTDLDDETILVGTYVTPTHPGAMTTVPLKFEITNKMITQEMPSHHLLKIQPFEMRRFKRLSNGELEWLETWGRYQDGAELIWIKESEMVVRHYAIDGASLPITQVNMFRRGFYALRSLYRDQRHFDTIIQHACKINLRNMTHPMRTPFAAPSDELVTLYKKVQNYVLVVGIDGPQGADSPSDEDLIQMMLGLLTHWYVATGQYRPSTRTDRGQSEQAWIYKSLEQTVRSVHERSSLWERAGHLSTENQIPVLEQLLTDEPVQKNGSKAKKKKGG